MIPAAAPSIGQYTIHNNSLVFYGVDLSASDLCFPIGKCLVVWLGRLGAQSSESKGWLSSCDIAQVYELLLSHPISELSNLQCTLCVRLGSAEQHNNQLAAEKVRLSGVRGEQCRAI